MKLDLGPDNAEARALEAGREAESLLDVSFPEWERGLKLESSPKTEYPAALDIQYRAKQDQVARLDNKLGLAIQQQQSRLHPPDHFLSTSSREFGILMTVHLLPRAVAGCVVTPALTS